MLIGSILCKICNGSIEKSQYDLNQTIKLNCKCNQHCHKECLKKQIVQKKEEFESLDAIEKIVNETIKCEQCSLNNIVNQSMIKSALGQKLIDRYIIEYKESQKQKYEEEQTKLEEEKQNQVANLECQICCNDFDLNKEGCALKCGCQFCINCLKLQIKESFKGNIYLELENLLCPGGCKKALDFQEISFILKDDKEMIEKLEQKNIISVFQKIKRENPDTNEVLVICPGKYKVQKDDGKVIYISKDQIEKQRQGNDNIPYGDNEIIIDCNFTFIQDKTEQKQIHKCQKCKYEFCLNNCDSTHEGFTCSNYQKWKIENTKDYAQELFAQGLRICPNKACCVLTQRDGGCNRITCTNCKISYCYLCYFFAQTAEEVYTHLIQKHGGYWGDA